MKKILIAVFAMASFLIFNSCGVNHALVVNENQNSTQVHLSSNNYKSVEKITGSAEVTYVLVFGGMSKTRLYENAYADMISNANLMSGAKALVNIVTEDHIGGVPPFYYKRTITVSAHVIEFTK